MHRPVRWGIFGGALLVAIGGIVGGVRYQQGLHHLSLAESAIHQNQLQTAAQEIQQAKRSWPWIATAALQQQILGAQAANERYSQAMTSVNAGHFNQAEKDFAAIPSWSVHYPAAQDWLKRLHTAFSEAQAAQKILDDGRAVLQALDTFNTDYQPAVANLNQLQQAVYNFGLPPASELASASSVVGRLQQDVQTLQAALLTLNSSLSGVTATKPWNTVPVQNLESQGTALVQDANAISQAFYNDVEIFSRLNGSTVSFLDSNTALSHLQSAAIAFKNALAAFAGSAVGLISNELGTSQHIGQLLPEAPPSPAALPPQVPSTPNPPTSSVASSGSQTLTLFYDSADGITVDVPAGWSKAPLVGGDWSGWKFVNPADPNQEEILVSSGCVGCYYPQGDLTAKPDPRLVVPEQNVSSQFVFNHGLSDGYAFWLPGNPYPGNGVVTVSTDQNGFGYVEVLLPPGEKPLATTILNSFHLSL